MAGDLEELITIAAGAAESRGHELGPWTSPQGEEPVVRQAVCRRCGSVAHVRAEPGLSGMTGRALMEPCSRKLDPTAHR